MSIHFHLSFVILDLLPDRQQVSFLDNARDDIFPNQLA